MGENMKHLHKNEIDILFLDGLEPPYANHATSFLSYLFPLAAKLEETNYNFKILNLTTMEDFSLQGLIECIKKYKIKSIGMTTNVDNINYVYKITDAIKSNFPEIKIILGGAQATYSDLKTLSFCKGDIIIRHEADNIIIDVLDHIIKNTGNLNDILGLTFRTENGEIKQNRKSEIVDLNSIPTPQYNIVRDMKYWIVPENCIYPDFTKFLKQVAQINSIFLTGRGCPYRCGFCVEGNSNQKSRKRDASKVINDLHYFLEAFDTPYIVIGDDTFTSDRQRVIEMCKELKKKREERDFVWFAEGRANILSRNLDLLPIMVDAGLYKLQLGIETGSQKILDIYKKQITLEQILTVTKECTKYDDMVLHGNFILGNPGETMETFQESIDFAKKLMDVSNYKIDITCGYLVPFAGTPIAEDPGKYELELLCADFEVEKRVFVDPICKPKDITLDDLKSLYYKFNSEITKHYKKNIWKYPKKVVDRKVKFDLKYGGVNTGVVTRIWLNTYYKLITMQRYYDLYLQDSTLNLPTDNLKIDDIKNLCPLKLWDINYNEKDKSYSFISFNGEEFIISGNDCFLWEMASGKNTICEIVNDEHSPFPINERSICQAYTFYQSVESNYALILRKF